MKEDDKVTTALVLGLIIGFLLGLFIIWFGSQLQSRYRILIIRDSGEKSISKLSSSGPAYKLYEGTKLEGLHSVRIIREIEKKYKEK